MFSSNLAHTLIHCANSFLPMSHTPLQLTDYRSPFSFELAARMIGGLFRAESLVFQVNVVDPFNSNTW
jgi:hypothetical protein